MTISYHLQLASVSLLGVLGVLFRWKGSVWKLVYKEVLIWIALFLFISLFLRTSLVGLNDSQKIKLKYLFDYFDTGLVYIPLTFIMGFFFDTIVLRWIDIFNNMGYIEAYAIYIGNYLRGDDVETRLQRRAMVRYMCLSQVLVFRDISKRVRKRFPTMQSIVEAGIMTEEENSKLESIVLDYDKYWTPIQWTHTIAFNARKQGKILHDLMLSKLCDEINKFRYNLQLLCNYDWVPLPLVYPQAVILAVYIFFAICLVSRQFIITDQVKAENVDLRISMPFPIMTVVQLFFYIGFTKVALVLLNPFGDDDDDFECNFLIDKNLATSLTIVDNYDCVPDVMEDKFLVRTKIAPSYDLVPLAGSAIRAKFHTSGDEPQRMVIRRASERSQSLFMRKISKSIFSKKCSVGNSGSWGRKHPTVAKPSSKLQLSDQSAAGKYPTLVIPSSCTI